MTLEELRARRDQPKPPPTLPTARQVFTAMALAMSRKRELILEGMSVYEAETRWRAARAVARERRDPWSLIELLDTVIP